jgi:GAF domain-containing protein
MSHEETIGVIDVSKPGAAGEWTQDEIAQLESMTYQLGVALENARSYEDTQDRALRERLMNEAASRIRASLNVDTILQTAVQEMREMLGLEEAEMRLDIEFEQSG